MRITISRYSCDKVRLKYWKNLISALCLVGYKVYADDDMIVFELGNEDKAEEEICKNHNGK